MNDMQDAQDASWVLRIFNGPLQGCEFKLVERRTLFMVGPQERFCDNQQPLSIPADALYIPLARDGCNFEVLVTGNAVTGLNLRILGEGDVQERVCAKQTLESVGGLRFAVRPANEPWDDALLGADDPPLLEVLEGRGKNTAPPWAGAVAGLVAVALLAGGWYWLRPNPIADVQTLISGSSAGFTVLHGRDRTLYAFAASERDANWGRQVLERSQHKPTTRVLTPADEQDRLQRLVAAAEPALAWHSIDLSDPGQPQLLVSNQRNLLTPALQQRLTTLLREAAPYARDVTVAGRDDQQLAGLAEQGLKRLGLSYSRSAHANSVTFTLQGSLRDVELQAVREYVAGFYRQWGDRYVHFAIELHDDWLKGKSFQYGPQGYVKMAPSSWYFPKPI
jgi:type III secretion system PrgH/EprH family protein